MTISALMLDCNEAATAPWTDKLTFGGIPKMVTNLEWGDITAVTSNGDMVIIERKTPSDLLNSIGDKHIFSQAAGMRSFSPWCYLLITGPLTATSSGHVVADSRVTGWRWTSVQGALLEIQEMGVRIVYCLGEKEYEPTVMQLCNRERNKEKVLEPTTQSRSMSPGEILLTSLPGIGIERAQLLLSQFNNDPARALVWLTRKKSTIGIAGLGEGVKRAVKSALCLGEWEEMFVLNGAHFPDVADYLYQAEIQEKEILA